MDGRYRAVNTVVLCGDHAYGYNTDWLGVGPTLSTDRAHGQQSRWGTAAAAAYALLSLDMDVRILAAADTARKAADRFGCRWGTRIQGC